MKKLLIFIVICFGSWQFFLKDSAIIESFDEGSVTPLLNNTALQTLARAKEIANPKASFNCDGRQYCSQMNSYEEAKYFIQHCPGTKMDGDNDGIPCERQFGK